MTHRWLVYGDYEGPSQMSWLKRWLSSGGVFIDSGANIGQYVVSLSSLPGLETLAFEPVSHEREWLQRCLRRYPDWKVRVISSALGECEQQISIRVAGGRSTLRRDWYQDSSLTEETVEMTTLDQFACREGLGRIRLWKLDMEGYEPKALAGARRLVADRRIDALLIEAQSATLPLIFESLSVGCYGLFRLSASGRLSHVSLSHFPFGFEGNLIALPPGADLT